MTRTAENFWNDIATSIETILLNLSVQRLRADASDIETDSFIQACEYLALSITWMRGNERPISILNYQCITRMKQRTLSKINAASGEVIYKQVSAKSTCRRLNINIISQSKHTR